MEAETYNQIRVSVKRILNIDLTYYKDEQMKRRLDSWLIRNNAKSWGDYLQLISANSDELSRFRDYLTINVTEFFRDPERWSMLAERVLPMLMGSPKKALRVWSAGCSIGVEAYTLAMLLDDATPTLRHSLLATDIDRAVLLKAKTGGPYREDEIRNMPDQFRRKYMDARENAFFVKERLTKNVQFREQDLLIDRFDQGFDLIVCRNVVIYFTNEAKSTLYKKFHAALRPGGVLFLGGTEIIPSAADVGFKNYGFSFYIKEA
jgi:chemotaxis protein methyltransferase CheR